MVIRVDERPAQELLDSHQKFRDEADCQLVHDSFWFRGFLDTYLIEVDRSVAGHAAVANRYGKGRLLEFYLHPEFRSHASQIFAEVVRASCATHIEAQSNIPLMSAMFEQFAIEKTVEKKLFADGGRTQLRAPSGAVFRRKREAGEPAIFPHQLEPEGDWVVEADGEVVATGGFLTHYNPPYADLYMEVALQHRRRGFGSYLLQEVKRVCYAAGKLPAARCSPENEASRRTLEKAGLVLCGELLVGSVALFP